MKAEEILRSLGIAPPPDKPLVIDPERRLEWRRALRTFKRALKVRHKLGIVDHLCQEVARERASGKVWEMPDWDTPYWRGKLYDALTTGVCDTELVKGFVQSIGRTYITQSSPRPIDFLDTVERVFKAQSFALRQRFGVFIDAEQQEAPQEVPSEAHPRQPSGSCA
jgi:hypothetical protein